MTLEHLGIAVADARDALALFERLLGHAPYKSETVEREGVRTYFLGDDGVSGAAPKLELLEALGPDSPVATFLEKRGPGLHHVAFEVDDIEAEMARLRALGFRLLADAPKPGADGKRIVFLHPRSTAGVLVELCQSVTVEPERIAIPFEDGALAAFVYGPEDAPPLVVLHAALGSTRLETDRLARRWARDFRVYALDFMAHGASDPFPDRPLHLGDFTANVVALLDTVGLETTHLFGFSMGGSVALDVARRHPGRLRRLAVHAHNVQWSEDEVATMTAFMQRGLDDPAGFWARRLAETHGSGWEHLVARMIAFTRPLARQHMADEALTAISGPTLCSVGDRDRFFGLRHTLRLFDTLPDARLAVLPGVDHAIQSADPDGLAALVRSHLLAA